MPVRWNKVCAVLFCLIFLSSMPGQSVFGKNSVAKDVGIDEVAELVKKKPSELMIVDVRAPAEFSEGHLDGARNMDFFGSKFDAQIQTLPKDKTILLYCRSGIRSAAAAETLSRLGFDKLIHMSAGIEAWKKAGLPLAKIDNNKN